MKKLTIFILTNCPYCRRALSDLGQLMEDTVYDSIEVELIDEVEEKDLANQFDYYYVPCFYYKNIKLHEGATTIEILREILEKIRMDA